MFEVFGQDISREIVLVDDDKADSIGSPSYGIMVLFILNGMDSTPRSSQVFFKKLETALGFLLVWEMSDDTCIALVGNRNIQSIEIKVVRKDVRENWREIKIRQINQFCAFSVYDGILRVFEGYGEQVFRFSKDKSQCILRKILKSPQKGMTKNVSYSLLVQLSPPDILELWQLSQVLRQQQMKMAYKQKVGLDSRLGNEGGNISAINGIVKEFVINTIDMVKNNIHEEDHIIEHMLDLLQKKMTQMYSKQPAIPEIPTKNDAGQRLVLKNIQSAVQQLNKDSDLLSQRLFDLSQSLVQNRILEIEQQKREIERNYDNKLLRLKNQYQNQKVLLQAELKQYKQKCYILQECLQSREEMIRKQLQKQEQNRKNELSKYLQAIEAIYSQIQILKNFSNQQSYNESEQMYEYQKSPKAYNDNYSEQYYNTRRDQRSTQAGSHQRRIKSPSNYNYADYHTEADRRTYQSREQTEVDRRQIDRRSNSKIKQIEPRYVQIATPNRHNYYLKSDADRRERSRSSDKQKRDRRDSNYKTRPVILHYQTPPEIKSYGTRQSQIYTKRSLNSNHQGQLRKIEQKNMRMQGVQEKLHGLKRKLERQLKTMKN